MKRAAIAVTVGTVAGLALALGGMYVVLCYGPDLNQEF